MIRRHLSLIALAICWPWAATGQDPAGRPRVKISTDFPGGNVLVVENRGATVRLKPDLRGGRDWFYWHFEATAAEAGAVEFVFEGKLRIGVRGPAVSDDGGRNWRWLGTEPVRYSEKGMEDPTESFRYTFIEKNQKVRFAVAIPYLQRELDAFLLRIDGNPHLTRSKLTATRAGKPVELLRVGETGPNRESVIVTARHHCCESMASYVLEGFLEEALSETPAGRAFRERYVLYAVPMMDKDGVQAGDQGKWRFPHDHNRDYGHRSIYPEVQAVQKLAKEVDVKLALDFHCPSLRGETHEVFYFIGVGLPHIRDNTEELKGWITEERPHAVRTGPFNFLRDPPEEAPKVLEDTKFSVWFTYLEGVRFAATFEIPYTQPNCPLDAAMARNYGHATLRAWEHSEFVAEPGTRTPHGHAGLIDFRKTFSAEYKSRPEDAEKKAGALLKNSAIPSVFQAEGRNSLGLLRLRQRRFDEALGYFDSVLAHEQASTGQRLTAATQKVVTICRIPETTAEAVAGAVREFETVPYPSASAQFEAFGAVSAFFESEGDFARALAFAQRQLPGASKYQKGETLNRIAVFQDRLKKPEDALAARKAAVAHLSEQLDPVPVGIFGALMARDLFDALRGIPDASLQEKRAAADLVLNHKIASSRMKDEVRAALADLEKAGQ